MGNYIVVVEFFDEHSVPFLEVVLVGSRLDGGSGNPSGGLNDEMA